MQLLNAQGLVPVRVADGIQQVKSATNTKGNPPEEFLVKGQWEALMNKLPQAIEHYDQKYFWSYDRADDIDPKSPQSLSQLTLKAGAVPQNIGKNNAQAVFKMRTEKDGFIAQNTINPLPVFYDHVVVQWGERIYDPSYGKRFESRDSFVTESFSAFVVWAVYKKNPVWLFREPTGADDMTGWRDEKKNK